MKNNKKIQLSLDEISNMMEILFNDRVIVNFKFKKQRKKSNAFAEFNHSTNTLELKTKDDETFFRFFALRINNKKHVLKFNNDFLKSVNFHISPNDLQEPYFFFKFNS